MVTINDIAEKAEVSKSTVSKVLNNYSDVNEKTRKKIMKIMKEYNYRPNATARSLSTNKSFLIGVFIASNLNDLFFREVIYGIEKTLGAKGYDLVYFADNRWGEIDLDYGFVEKCRNRHVDGVILVSFVNRDLAKFNNLIESSIPSVFVDLDIIGKKTSFITSNHIEGVEKAINYLNKLGHKKIGLIDGIIQSIPAQNRFMGFQRNIEKSGLIYNPDWVHRVKYEEKLGYESMNKILDMSNQPTAIFAQDVLAIGAIQAIRERGLEVPGDFSVIGYDDIELSRHYDLTTIRQNKFQLGKKASELLLKIMKGKSFSPVQVETEFVERGTCRKI